MTCVIHASAAIGALSSANSLDSITIHGSVDNTGATPCHTLKVTVSCGSQTIGPLVVSVTYPSGGGSTGTWVAQFTGAQVGPLSDCCGHLLTIDARCDTGCELIAQIPLECQSEQPGCPKIDLSAVTSACDGAGDVTVTVTGSVTPAGASATLAWSVDNVQQSAFTVTGSTTVTLGPLTFPGDGASHTFALVVIVPRLCPPVEVVVTTPVCAPPCPIVTVGAKAGACNPDGTVYLDCEASVLLSSSSPVTLQWTIDGVAVGAPFTANASGTYQLSPLPSLPGDGGVHQVGITVVAPAGCGAVVTSVTLPNCQSAACPDIAITCSAGACRADGTVELDCQAAVTLNGSSVTLAWVVDGAQYGSPFTVSASGVIQISPMPVVAGDGAAHTVALQVISPSCPDAVATITVPLCHPTACPHVTVTHVVGKCNPDGTVPVTITAVFTGQNPTDAINAELLGSGWTQTASGVGSVTITTVQSYNTGAQEVAAMVPGCPPVFDFFTVFDCCPIVSFDSHVGGWPICDFNGGKRPVDITATVQPQEPGTVSAHLVDVSSGQVMGSASGSGTLVINGSGQYPPGDYTVQVVFDPPLKCPPKSYDFCVPECESTKCFVLRCTTLTLVCAAAFMQLLRAAAALSTVIVYYFPGLAFLVQRYLVTDAWVGAHTLLINLVTAAAIVALIYWFICITIFGVHIGSCCTSKCGRRLALWQLCLMLFATCLCFVAASMLVMLVFALVFYLLYRLFLKQWKKKCCTTPCDTLFHTFWPISLVLVEVIAMLGLFGVNSILTGAILFWAIVAVDLSYVLMLVIGIYMLSLVFKLGNCK